MAHAWWRDSDYELFDRLTRERDEARELYRETEEKYANEVAAHDGTTRERDEARADARHWEEQCLTGMANAREEQREACAQYVVAIGPAGRGDNYDNAIDDAVDAVRATPLTATPLADALDAERAKVARLREALTGLLVNLNGYEHHPDLCSRTMECDEKDEDGCSYCGEDACPACECGLAKTQDAMEVARTALGETKP